MRRPVYVLEARPWWADAIGVCLAALPVLALLLVALFFAGCGDNAAQAPTDVPVICSDVVIWRSPESDCIAAGGVYGRRVWPVSGGTDQPVCDFCGCAP